MRGKGIVEAIAESIFDAFNTGFFHIVKAVEFMSVLIRTHIQAVDQVIHFVVEVGQRTVAAIPFAFDSQVPAGRCFRLEIRIAHDMHPGRSHLTIQIIEELHERRRAETFAVIRFDAEIITRVVRHAEFR